MMAVFYIDSCFLV